MQILKTFISGRFENESNPVEYVINILEREVMIEEHNINIVKKL
jgi:hypothetical protein